MAVLDEAHNPKHKDGSGMGSIGNYASVGTQSMEQSREAGDGARREAGKQ